MDEALLSEAIHHGFLFRKRTVGGERDRIEPDTGRQKDTNKALCVSSEPQNSALKTDVKQAKPSNST